ncbi:fas apoptotic inhibitory molecule 1 [Ctenocephalides felis]|uniref:fas apoptotic inhibitory molecule 1 n=1 Tax=Ctenocephalides felis TaxID=7515 RepID=UPI000E6E42F5|nr:fas apoptotic inhibitory molecule 1 [Ctenocephalides felis]
MLENKKKSPSKEIVGSWDVPLRGKIYKVEFEHGTTTGKRVLWIDGQEIFRRDWMFKLVGDECFDLGNTRCIITVDPLPGFRYSYTLLVDGEPFKQFADAQSRVLCTWRVLIDGSKTHRVVLEKDTLDIWLDGAVITETSEFVDGGTDTNFTVGGQPALLTARTSGDKRKGIIYTLYINGAAVAPSTDTK